jgi:hypothetical protein
VVERVLRAAAFFAFAPAPASFNLVLCLDDDADPAAKPAEPLIMQVGGTGIEPATRAV